jgi:hypothetical protein
MAQAGEGGWEYPSKCKGTIGSEPGWKKMSAATVVWHERTAALPPLRESPDGLATTTFDRDTSGSGSS